MTQEKLEQVTDEVVKECKRLLLVKGADYSKKNDRISNFRVNAERLGLTAKQVWAIYFEKHINAIETYITTGGLSSEPIQGRIVDAINYLILLAAILEEEKQARPFNEGTPQND